MRVCYFGTYSISDGYPRNRVLIQGLRLAGVDVYECNVTLWSDTSEKTGGINRPAGIIRKLPAFLKAQFELAVKYINAGKCDAIIVGSIGHFDILTVKILNFLNRKPVIFDAFISLFDTVVNDRKLVAEGTLIAKFLHATDRITCKLVDCVVLDTKNQSDYFHKEFRVPKSKLVEIPVGADGNVFNPVSFYKKRDVFNVLFFGTYIPLHGIEFIVKSAKILENRRDIHYTIIGTGQEGNRILNIAQELSVKNVNFIRKFLPEKELAEEISNSDICLGIFGTTEKAKVVIPCKVYNCLAMRKAVITADTPAIRELLKHNETALLVPCGNAEALAEAIITLHDDIELRNSIAESGYRVYSKRASTLFIGKTMKTVIQDMISNKRNSWEDE